MAEGAAPGGYRFEPLPRGGLIFGLSAGQVVVVACAVAVAFLAVKALHGILGFGAAAVAIGAAVAACRPVAGRSPLQWAAVTVRFGLRRHRQVATPPALRRSCAGVHAAPSSTLALPAGAFLGGGYLCELPASAGQGALGVLLDERAGLASALLRARGGPFCLLDGAGKERRLSAWAALLESVANQPSCLARLQWCQRALPGQAGQLLEHLRAAADATSPGFGGQERLVVDAGTRSWRHETVLVVSVRAPVRRGRLPEEAARALRSELGSLRSQLHNAGIACDGPLDGRSSALTVCAYLLPGLEQYPLSYAWPLASEEHWAEVRVEGCWHRTYWVAEWPRSWVGPDFLSPLLVGKGWRSFSVHMAPIAPEKAARDAESSRTAQLADARLRAQGGFLETARQRRQAEAIKGREAELADGRGAYEMSGYVTVSAPSSSQLEEAAAQLERAAGAARISLRALYGQQKEALSWALPLGRGL